MVATINWMPLWLALVKVSKASESLIEGIPVTERIQSELTPDSVEQLEKLALGSFKTADDEHNDGDLALKKQNYSFGLPRKMLRTKEKKVVDETKHDEDSENIGRPLTSEEKAEIRRKLAMYQKDLTAMKASGEPMNKWFKLIIEREDMLERYTASAKESTTSIVMKLKIIQQEINAVVRARMREWGGLSGTILEPKEENVISPSPDKMVHGCIENFETSVGVQIQSQRNALLSAQNQKIGLAVEEITKKEKSSIEEALPKKSLESAKKEIEGQKGPKTQLTQHYINILYQHIMESDFNDLSEMLHSVSFRDWNLAPWKSYQEEIRVIKLAFEKTILQALLFMVEFKLIKQEHFKHFLSKPQTLDLFGNHLVGLFHVIRYETYNALAFIPDIEFVKEHWIAAHLKEIWQVLDESQKSYILAKVLAINVEIYIACVKGFDSTHYTEVIQRVSFENILRKLENETKINDPSSKFGSTCDNDLQVWVGEIVKLYIDPSLLSGRLVPIRYAYREYLVKLQTEYILLHHILNFVKTYHESYLRSIVEKENLIEFSMLVKQLQLFNQGIKVHQVIQQFQTFSEILMLPNQAEYMVSSSDAFLKKQKTEEAYEVESDIYRNLRTEFQQIIYNNSVAKNWFEGNYCISKSILSSFSSRSNSFYGGIKKEIARRTWFRNQYDKNKKNQTFPSLELSGYDAPHVKKAFKHPGKELLDLFDPQCVLI